MKALVKQHAEPGLSWVDVPEPVCGADEVLIRVSKTGICGTDLHIWKWDDWAKRTIPVPMVVGHEFVGEIVEVGDRVEAYQVGHVVSGEGHIVKSRCRNFYAGRHHLCAEVEGVGVQRAGAFAEYLAIPARNVWHHKPGISEDVMAIFDPFGNATHTALQYDVLGEDVLITGAGPIGCMAAGIVRHAGARHVVVTDVNDFRLNLAKKLGATRTVNVGRENLKDVQRELKMEEGFDVGLEMSGHAGAFGDMIANMCHGGKIAVLGIFPEKVALDMDPIIFGMLTIRGVYGRQMFETWYKMTVMLQSGLDVEPIITHRLPAREYRAGFDAMLGGDCGKVILDWRQL